MTKPPTRRRIAQAILIAFGIAHGAQVPAMPTGADVSTGQAVISSSGAQMTIHQSTPKAAINWQQFNIAPGESVQFIQPGVSAIALNRVLGQDPSAILGRLSANGQIFLLNPNGVLFGPGAQVNVGGVVASTLNLSDADFLAGRYGFSGQGGSVVNQGTIEAAEGGYVVLLAPRVTNEGVISARLGAAALAAGEQVTLTLSGNQLLAVAVDRDTVGALVANKQLIQAEGGQVILTAKARDALLDTVVNNGGVVEARSVSSRNGVIRLEGGTSGVVAVNGTLDASGHSAAVTGGYIEITGEKVALLPGAQVDASGASGGGTVLIGGDVQGGNPGVRNADRTFVAQGAEVSADATANGNGGKIVVWGTTSAQVHGALTANGGAETGDGGFVETSGKHLDVDGARIEAAAPNGRGGTWLLDPYNVTISGAATANTDNNPNTAPNWNATGNNAVVQAGAIEGKLNVGTSVIVTTGGGAVGQNGDLTVAANIAKTLGPDASLSLRAHDMITLNNNVSISSTSGQLDVTLNSDSDGVNGGSILLNSGSSVLSNGGNVTLGGGASPATTPAIGGATSQAYGVLINNATIDAGGGNVIVNGQGRSTGGANNYGVRMQNGASIQTTGAGTITVTGAGGDGTNNNMGVRMDNASTVTTVDGAIAVTGTGAAGSTGNGNSGVYLNGGNAKLVATGTGSVSVTGIAGGGVSNNRGIQMDTNDSRIETVSGNIALAGTGSGSGANNYGVYVTGADARVASASGNVVVNGTGGAGTNNNYGVYVNGTDARVESGVGNVIVTGQSAGTGANNFGTYINGTDARVASAGNVTVTGQGNGTGTANYGVRLQNAARVEATGTGAVTVTGTGGNGTTNNYGIYLQSNDTRITSVSGTIAVTGTGGAGTGNNNYGVYVNGNGARIESTDGAIAVTGQSAGTGANNSGVRMQGQSRIAATGTGAVAVTGTGGNGTTANYGVHLLTNNTQITSTTGNLAVTGTGGNGTDTNYGVFLQNTTQVSSTTGDIAVNGSGIGSGANNHGVYLNGTDARVASASGNVAVTGTGGAGTDNNYGVYLNGNGARIESTDGAIAVTGQSAGTGAGNSGVRMQGQARIEVTGTGAVAVTGTGGNGTTANYGVHLLTNNTQITSTTGNIAVTGTGGNGTDTNNGVFLQNTTQVLSTTGDITVTGSGSGSGANNYGVYVNGGNARFESTGGNVTVTGTGGVGTTDNYGVYLNGTDARVASASGNVAVTGTGGAGTDNNYGAYLTGTRARVESGSGNVTLTGQGAGTGNDNYGVRLNTNAQATSTGAGTGAIALTGTGAGTAPGIITTGGGAGTLIGAAGHSGAITISADTATGPDSVVLANSSIQGTGQLVLQPVNPASTIGVAGGAGEFNLSTTELGYIQNGFDTITIGRSNGSGAMTTGAYAHNADVTLRGATSNISVGTTTMPAPGGNDAGTLTIDTAGTVTQNGPITATNLVLLGAGGNHTLTNAGNAVQTLAASTGSVNFANSGALTVGTVGATVGVATTGDATVVTAPGAGSDITLANNVGSTGGNVVIASGEDIHYGTATISAGGRWLTYSRSPAQNTGTVPAPGNAEPNLYNRTYAADPPPTITQPGNHNIYSYQPSLTVTADNQNKIYGEAVPVLTATITGLVNGDTPADAYSGSPGLGTPATPTSSVAGNPYPVFVGPGTLMSDVGYTFTYVNGQLVVIARPVTITADAGQTKVYGDPNPPAYTYTITGGAGTTGTPIVAGDTVTGALARVAGENVGAYAVNQSTLAVNPAIDYNVTYLGNNFVITPVTLQYVADPVSVPAFSPMPAFTGTVTGFKGADNLGNATTGTLTFSTTVSNTFVAGMYPIWGAGLSANNGNYVFVQAPGNATAFDVVATGKSDAIGTVRAQRIRRCTDDPFAYAAPVGTLPCALPGDRGARPAPLQAFTIEGSGIRLPEGVR